MLPVRNLFIYSYIKNPHYTDVLHKISLHITITYIAPTMCLAQRALHAVIHLTGTTNQ